MAVLVNFALGLDRCPEQRSLEQHDRIILEPRGDKSVPRIGHMASTNREPDSPLIAAR